MADDTAATPRPGLARRIGAGLRRVGPALGVAVEGAALLAGGGLIAFGAWQIYPPAGPIVGGLLLAAGVILRARGGG